MTPSLLRGLLLIGTAASAVAAPLQVSALHPLMADLARQVGGERVVVFDMVGEGGNPHRFEPRPADLERLQGSALVLAAGKNQEPYLSRLRETLQGVTVVEVGSTIPSLTVGTDAVYACCPEHASGTADPHWWHGVEHMRRAARVVAQAMAEKDTTGKQFYLDHASAYGTRLERLQRWARSELAKVPRGQRKLVTAHNAFGYFAKEFGFEVIAVAGLNQEQNNTPQELAATIAAVKQAGVKAIFPEHNSNSKVLQSIATATATTLATPLIADGNGSGADAGFEGMIRHNVEAITRALATPLMGFTMLHSPLAGTAAVLATLGMLAIPLRHLTSAGSPPPATPVHTTPPAAAATTPGVLRLKLLTAARSIRIKSETGAILVDRTDVAAGESEQDVALSLQDGQLELLLEADLGDNPADTAVFLTVMPDAHEAQTRYSIGSGSLSEPLRYDWHNH